MKTFKDLRPIQKTVTDLVYDNPAYGVFMEMGLGKTVVILTAILDLFDMGEITKGVLVVSTKNIANNVWDSEVENWRHLKSLKVVPIFGTPKQRLRLLRQPANIHCISVDNFAWLLGELSGNIKNKFDMIVLDESSLVKNHDTKRFKYLAKAFSQVNRKVIMTGTPTPNSMLELWTQIFLLDSGARLYPHITKFRTVYGQPNPDGFGWSMRPKMDKILLNAISDICISIRGKDYGVHSEIIESVRRIHLSEEELANYDSFVQDAVYTFFQGEDEIEINPINAAVLTNKLLQYSNGGLYDDEKNTHYIHDAKFDAFSDLLDEINAHGKTPILVACMYKFVKDRVKLICEQKNLVVAVFGGQNEAKTAQLIRDWNNKLIDVMIMHPKSGGHGLNLQFGGYNIIWFGVNTSVETELQMNARLARTGQTQIVKKYVLIARGTLEDKYLKRANDKIKIQDFVLDYLKQF